MPRKKQTTGKSAEQIAEPTTSTPSQDQVRDKKWAEPYRPIVSNPNAGFELGENKLTQQMVFHFGADPGAEVKARLKDRGYRYHTEQKAWTVNATPLTRELARNLASEFAGEKGRTR